MICEFCKETIADEALICSHCRRKTAAGRSTAGSAVAKTLLTIVAVAVVGFLLLAAIGSTLPEKTPSQRINEACESQYAGDMKGQDDCKLALTVKALEDQRRDQLESAAREAHVDVR